MNPNADYIPMDIDLNHLNDFLKNELDRAYSPSPTATDEHELSPEIIQELRIIFSINKT